MRSMNRDMGSRSALVIRRDRAVPGAREGGAAPSCSRASAGLKSGGLPAGLGGLTGLQTLDLSLCSELTGLPESLGGLTGLQTLNLSWGSGLTGRPEARGGGTGRQTRWVPGR